jgi:hypothetical protein
MPRRRQGIAAERLLMFATLLVAAALQAAAAPASPPDDDIVVTGQRPMTRQEIEHHVAGIARTEQGQMSRFATPVCPSVVGMPPEHKPVIVARIREVAAGAGVKLAGAGCAPNLTLIVVDDAAAFVEAVRPTLIFADLEPWEIRRLKREGPVRAWNRTQIVNEHLQAVGGGTGSDENGKGSLRVHSASILKEPTQQVILEAFVLIDESAVLGKSLVQLADYVALRTLAETRPPAPGTGNTILTLFDADSDTPAEATMLDRAYLRGLYASQAMRTSRQQKGRIATLIDSALRATRRPGRTDRRGRPTAGPCVE